MSKKIYFRLKLQRDQLLFRSFGVFIGSGFCALGLYSLLAVGDEVSAVVRERAFGFGATALLIGLLAVAVSLWVKNLDNIWCRPPKRW